MFFYFGTGSVLEVSNNSVLGELTKGQNKGSISHLQCHIEFQSAEHCSYLTGKVRLQGEGAVLTAPWVLMFLGPSFSAIQLFLVAPWSLNCLLYHRTTIQSLIPCAVSTWKKNPWRPWTTTGPSKTPKGPGLNDSLYRSAQKLLIQCQHVA